MPNKKISPTHASSTSVTSSPSTHSTAAPASKSSPAPVQGAGAPVTPVAATTAAAVSLFLRAPPATASIPVVPSNFVPESGANYRGTAPKKSELLALPLAVTDLQSFTNYTQVIGGTAPSYDSLLQIFDVTNQWSSMRTSSAAWDAYCEDQEGICWRAMRTVMDRLKPAFELAATGDPSLQTKYAGLTTLLGAKQAIAKKAVSTRRANKKAMAEGKAPTHGAIGKARKKSADKAIVAAANAAGVAGGTGTAGAQASVAPVQGAAAVAATAPGSASTGTQVSAPVAGATVVTAPVVTAPVVTNGASAPASAPVVNGASGVNGAGH